MEQVRRENLAEQDWSETRLVAIGSRCLENGRNAELRSVDVAYGIASSQEIFYRLAGLTLFIALIRLQEAELLQRGHQYFRLRI